MSYRVTDEFLTKSKSRHGTRMVGSVIAEVAHHDGVGWLRIAPSKSKRKRRNEDESIATRANVNEKTVRRAIEKLQELDELEVVVARDQFYPQETFYVYRLIVGRIRLLDVDYGRHGVPVPEGTFWTPEQLDLPVLDRPTDRHVFPSSDPRRADILSTRRAGDKRTSATESSGHPDPEQADNCDRDIHAREELGGPEEPSKRTVEKAAAAELAQVVGAAAASDLEEQLRQLSAGVELRLAAHAEPQRALAWIELARREATRNPAGFVMAGLRGGDWPSQRVPTSTSRSVREAWLEDAVPLLGAELAHEIVDGFDELDPGELAQWHQDVDDRLARRDDQRVRGAA